MNYKQIHDELISRAETRKKFDWCHKHHVIPRHEDVNSTETVFLTPKEHILIHHLRWRFTGTLGNRLAYLFMKGRQLAVNDCWFEHISQIQKKIWLELSDEEKNERISILQAGNKVWRDRLNEKEYKNYCDILSSVQIRRYQKITNEEKILRSDAIRQGRISMTQEKKNARALKIGIAHKSGKFESRNKILSEQRRGGNNPAAKKIVVLGVEYNSVREASDATGIASHILYRLRRKNESNGSPS